LHLSVRVLRFLELLLFGAMGAFFAWLQFTVFRADELMAVANTDRHSQEVVLGLAATNQALRWFILIVVYGTFIPNTWKRCAVVVGVLAVAPLLLTGSACVACDILSKFTQPAMFSQTIILAMGVAIAIFGSYKISELQQEAQAARKLGQYQLKQRLGAGGMGEVYLGEHMLLRRACAIKLIRADQSGEPTTLNRFEREVRAMATLTHPNTVEIYDYGRAEDGTFYYVMEYLPGLSLQELVDRFGPLSPARAVHFLRQVCGALFEAHSIGMIHRDIKPSNVIACERGGVNDVAKLLDFGLVQCVGLNAVSEKLTMQGTILGSPSYMSPEQAIGKERLDPRTDIYSLGALAYFLVTGRAPFERDTPMETLVAHVHESPPPLDKARPDLPEDLVAVVARCLRKNPDERYQDADSLEQALAACGCADDWDRHEAAAWWLEYQAGHRTTDTSPSSLYEPTADMASGSSAL
jgi:serine/threonine-protein kinase